MAKQHSRLLKELTFYGSYHSNPMNQIIHLIFVPLLWATGCVFLAYTGVLYPFSVQETLSAHGFSVVVPKFINEFTVINGAFILFAVYALYYVYVDLGAGLSLAPIMYGLFLGAQWFYDFFGSDLAWKYAGGLHILGWYMQIHIGHMIYEGRKPALLDSFFQSLVAAPLFVWFEVLFFLGFKRALKEDLDAAVAEVRHES